MSFFYSVGDGKFLEKSNDLFVLYDELANLYDPDLPDYDDGLNRPGYKPDPWTENDRPADIIEFKKLIGRL